MRNIKFASGEFYHIYNRGVDKRTIFSDSLDYSRFYLSMHLLNDEEDGLMDKWRNYARSNPKAELSEFRKLGFRQRPLVEFIAYSIISNHYHFLVKQLTKNGIEKFMHKLGTSYTKYFNTKYKRTGALFQSKFKAIHMTSNERLLYMSVYVNCNPEVHGIAKAERYRWCSFPEYIGKRKENLCKKEKVLDQFKNFADYADFASENIKSQIQIKEDEKLLLE